jgi:hypothetical protein
MTRQYYIVTDLLNELLGNDSVNTSQYATIGGAFSMRSVAIAAASGPVDWLDSAHVGTPTDAHATLAEACFLCVGSVKSGYKRDRFRKVAVQSSSSIVVRK